MSKDYVEKLKCEYVNLHSQFDYTDIDQGESATLIKNTIIDPQMAFSLCDDGYANKIGTIDKLQTTAWGSFHGMPEDLLVEILSKLPLKSLACFKSVSKQWQRLILVVVSLINNPKLLIFSASFEKRVLFRSIDNKTCDEIVCSPMDEYTLQNHPIMAYSSCHGLLLIQIGTDLFVWNPLTKFFKIVLTHRCLHHISDEVSIQADLCFDSFNNAYKVVLVYKYTPFTFNSESFYLATCGNNNWVKMNVPPSVENVSMGPIFKGYRHWISKKFGPSWDQRLDNSFVPSAMQTVYFDPNTNKFIEIPMPQPKREDELDFFLDLGVLNECLCITRWDDPTNSQANIELLVMKEYRNRDSWEVMLVFPNTPELRSYGSMEPLFQTKEGEIWVRVDMCSQEPSIKGYDIHGNFIREIWVLPIPEDNDYGTISNIILYEEISSIGGQFKENLIGS